MNDKESCNDSEVTDGTEREGNSSFLVHRVSHPDALLCWEPWHLMGVACERT